MQKISIISAKSTRIDANRSKKNVYITTTQHSYKNTTIYQGEFYSFYFPPMI